MTTTVIFNLFCFLLIFVSICFFVKWGVEHFVHSYHEEQRRAAARRAATRREQERLWQEYHEAIRRSQQQRWQQHYQYHQQQTRRVVKVPMTLEQAKRLLASYGGFKKAVMATHPDRGGNAADFRKVMDAKETIDKYGSFGVT